MKKPRPFVVKVPKTPRSAYNPDRPISTLIENQLRHLALVEQRLPKFHRSGVAIETLKTEGLASAYIQRVTAKLHPEGADAPIPDVAGKTRSDAAKKRVTKRSPRPKARARRTARKAASRRRR